MSIAWGAPRRHQRILRKMSDDPTTYTIERSRQPSFHDIVKLEKLCSFQEAEGPLRQRFFFGCAVVSMPFVRVAGSTSGVRVVKLEAQRFITSLSELEDMQNAIVTGRSRPKLRKGEGRRRSS